MQLQASLMILMLWSTVSKQEGRLVSGRIIGPPAIVVYSGYRLTSTSNTVATGKCSVVSKGIWYSSNMHVHRQCYGRCVKTWEIYSHW